MGLFFRILSLHLLIFCTDDQKFVASLDYALYSYVFFCNIIKFNHFLHHFIIMLHLISSSLLTVLGLWLFHMHVFLLNQLTAFFYHHLNLKQCYWLLQWKHYTFHFYIFAVFLIINLLLFMNFLLSLLRLST